MSRMGCGKPRTKAIAPVLSVSERRIAGGSRLAERRVVGVGERGIKALWWISLQASVCRSCSRSMLALLAESAAVRMGGNAARRWEGTGPLSRTHGGSHERTTRPPDHTTAMAVATAARKRARLKETVAEVQQVLAVEPPFVTKERFEKWSKRLKFSRGRWAGKAFKAPPWAVDALKQLQDDVDEDGLRIIRMMGFGMPKKSGKTELAAMIGLWGLCGLRRRVTRGLPDGQPRRGRQRTRCSARCGSWPRDSAKRSPSPSRGWRSGAPEQ